MDGARVRLANTGTRRGREVVQVYASRPDSASSVRRAGSRVRGRRGRRRRRGDRRRPARPARVPALGRRLGDRAGRVHARGGPLGRRPAADGSDDGAPAARVLRGGRAAPPLHPRRRGALRHAAGALPAGPPARGRARAHAVPPDIEGRRAHRRRSGPARPRREGAGGGRRGAGGHGPPYGDLARRRAGRLHRRRRAAAPGGARRLPQRPPGHPDRAAPGLGERGHRARRSAARVDVAVLALPGEPPPGVEATPLTEEPLRLAVPVDDELAGTTVAIEDLRGRPFILAEPGTALRETVVAATQAAGFSPLPLFEVGDPATVRYLVRANLGIGDRPGLLARAAGAGGRRGGSRATRRATGCRCSCPRRVRHRPAGCCTSACSSSDSQLALRARADELRDRRAVVEEHEGRQPEHAVLGGELLLVVARRR